MSLSATALIIFSGILSFTTLTAQDLPRCGSRAPSQTGPADVIAPRAYPRTRVFIPVVVHVVWNGEDQNVSDEVILNQIDILNKDYNQQNGDLDEVPQRFKKNIGNTGISFCLATVDPFGNTSSGIIRKQTNLSFIGSRRDNDGKRLIKHSALGGSDSWDVNTYLNIWVGDRDDFLGDSTFPTDEDVPNEEEGVVIKYSAFGFQSGNTGAFNAGRTLTHEIAHYFNIFHLFGSDTGCNSDDDFVSDTPRQSGPYFGCDPADNLQSCGSHDMATNFLNFRDDVCMNFFTKGQSLRMMDALFTYRYDLVNSKICNSDPVIPEDPLRVARIITMTSGVEIDLRTLEGHKYELHLYNVAGSRLMSFSDRPTNRYIVAAQPMGIYIVTLHFDGQVFGRKIFIP